MSGNEDRTVQILLIEPSQGVRELIAADLRQEGYGVEAVADGVTAIETMERQFFPCVIVGSPVPVEVENRERVLFLEYLEQHCPEWRPGVIVATTYVESEQMLSLAARLQVCAVLAKPFERADLLDVVRTCLSGEHHPTRWVGVPEGQVAAIR